MTEPNLSPWIDPNTQVCISISARPGGFGNRFHNFLYRELGLNFIYKGFACRDPKGALQGMRALGIRGCGVSMPFKEEVIPLLDELDPDAREIGAVNTIVQESGRLKGYNTDFLAMRKLLRDRAFPARERTALLGSGGMAKAAAHALSDLGFADVIVASRNERNGKALARKYGWAWAPELTEPTKAILNATPVGMTPDPPEKAPVDENFVRTASHVCDVIATPAETGLLRLARSLGKTVISGTEITILQGMEQFRLYTGREPSAAQVERAARFAFPG